MLFGKENYIIWNHFTRCLIFKSLRVYVPGLLILKAFLKRNLSSLINQEVSIEINSCYQILEILCFYSEIISYLHSYWLIDWLQFYAVSAIFQTCNGGYNQITSCYFMWIVHLFMPNNQIACIFIVVKYIVNLEICVISFTTMYLKVMSILECLFSCYAIESIDK